MSDDAPLAIPEEFVQFVEWEIGNLEGAVTYPHRLRADVREELVAGFARIFWQGHWHGASENQPAHDLPA